MTALTRDRVLQLLSGNDSPAGMNAFADIRVSKEYTIRGSSSGLVANYRGYIAGYRAQLVQEQVKVGKVHGYSRLFEGLRNYGQESMHISGIVTDNRCYVLFANWSCGELIGIVEMPLVRPERESPVSSP